MACYNCEHLIVNDKKNGVTNGCLYYCSKNKKYINSACDDCEAYSKDYKRETYLNNEIYYNGQHYCNSNSAPLSLQIILIIILIICALIANL